jgi:ubiquinone/menaquinone biosynthesis C-methylase UbiE
MSSSASPLAHRFWHAMNIVRQRLRVSLYNSGYRLAGSLDSYPWPPAHLVNLVIGTKELAWYQLGGAFMQQAIATLLRRNGLAFERFGSILDFGCGCGRILRWWAGLNNNSEMWGVDYNPDLIKWCQKELSTFAKFKVNHSDPPLDFEDEKFEFIYSYSVLTHLSLERQRPWLIELARILKPGGYLLLTVHGKRTAWRSGFSDRQLRQLDEQGVMVFGEEKSGSNYCAAYHSEAYMSSLQPLGLELIEYMSGGVRDSSEQDMYLYRKIEPTTQALK